MHMCLYVCMYVCIYVCLNVCVYVCMYVCAYVCVFVCTYTICGVFDWCRVELGIICVRCFPYNNWHIATHCNTLQYTATHCNTMQHTATHCNALQYTATHCNTLQRTATHYNTLQHAAMSRCNTRWSRYQLSTIIIHASTTVAIYGARSISAAPTAPKDDITKMRQNLLWSQHLQNVHQMYTKTAWL